MKNNSEPEVIMPVVFNFKNSSGVDMSVSVSEPHRVEFAKAILDATGIDGTISAGAAREIFMLDQNHYAMSIEKAFQIGGFTPVVKPSV